MATPRSAHTATLLPNGKVLIVGGETSWARIPDPVSDLAELYDPSNGTFTIVGKLTVERAVHTATLLPDGKVLIVGGNKGRYPNQIIHASAELFDPSNNSFTATGSMQVVRYKHAATLLPDGKVLIIGGSDSRDWQGRYPSAELFNPTSGSFSLTGNMSIARFKLQLAAVTLPDGKVLVAGSGKQAEIFDPNSNSFSVTGGMFDTERFYASTTLLPDGKVLVVGGYGTGNPTSTTGSWFYKP